jgi:hypothetical protein
VIENTIGGEAGGNEEEIQRRNPALHGALQSGCSRWAPIVPAVPVSASGKTATPVDPACLAEDAVDSAKAADNSGARR